MDRFDTFTGSILELYRCLQRLKDIEMRPLGLRPAHAICLYYLGKHPDGLTVTRLAEVSREDKASVSRCVANLIEQGLVDGNFPENKRSYGTKLRLTEEGQALAQKVYARVDAAVAGGGNGLTDEQRENLYSALNLINTNLSRYIKDREE